MTEQRVPSLADDYTSMGGSPEIMDTSLFLMKWNQLDAKNVPLILHMECLKLCEFRL